LSASQHLYKMTPEVIMNETLWKHIYNRDLLMHSEFKPFSSFLQFQEVYKSCMTRKRIVNGVYSIKQFDIPTTRWTFDDRKLYFSNDRSSIEILEFNSIPAPNNFQSYPFTSSYGPIPPPNYGPIPLASCDGKLYAGLGQEIMIWDLKTKEFCGKLMAG